MQKQFEINRTKIKGGCQSGRKVVPHDSESDLPLVLGKSPAAAGAAAFLPRGCPLAAGICVISIKWSHRKLPWHWQHVLGQALWI